jgi:hypothetical protein
MYVGIKIDKNGNQNIEINCKITQAHKVMNALNLIWWSKHIKKSEINICEALINSILTYGSEVWQTPTKEINKLLATEMDILRRSAGISRMDKVGNIK